MYMTITTNRLDTKLTSNRSRLYMIPSIPCLNVFNNIIRVRMFYIFIY